LRKVFHNRRIAAPLRAHEQVARSIDFRVARF
jgi:hypothetical protein